MENFIIEKIEPFAHADSSTPCGKAAYVIDRIAPIEMGVNMPKTFDDKSILDPKTVMFEDNSNVIIEIDLPGVPKKGIKVQVKDSLISVSGERAKPSGYKGQACSVVYQSTFLLPPNANSEKIEASYQDGLIRFVMPVKDNKKHQGTLEIKG